MHSCPSCAAPLDNEGICTSCGALARGFFRDLDLGAPQIAAAVAQGLDFYRLLEVPPDAETRMIARRYRQLRVHFPDDPRRLAPAPARRLALLEQAGRVLTDPSLRRVYDELRAGKDASLTTDVVRCTGCRALLPPGAAICAFCGVPRPAAHSAPASPPADAGPPPTEPADYYTLLGLTPQHLSTGLAKQIAPISGVARIELAAIDQLRIAGGLPPLPRGNPPTVADVDAASLERQRETLLTPGLDPQEREARVEELEIARRILRDERRRATYDALLLDFRQARFDGGRLDTLRHLQDLARADIAEERGDLPSADVAAGLLRQGVGYLNAGLPREAIAALQRAVKALPRSAEANIAYVNSILASDDPLSLGGHMLRQAQRSLDTLDQLGAMPAYGPALAALVRGLLARDQGEAAAAEAHLRQATQLDLRLAPAWRGLAALALARGATEETLSCCRRALAVNPRDERALLMAAAACLRAGQRGQAHEAAAQVAILRGDEWTADLVLEELA